MLSEILNLMQTGKTYSMQQLAETLHTSTEIVKSCIEYLEKSGYIKKVKAGTICSQNCNGCHGCDIQKLSKGPNMWEPVQ